MGVEQNALQASKSDFRRVELESHARAAEKQHLDAMLAKLRKDYEQCLKDVSSTRTSVGYTRLLLSIKRDDTLKTSMGLVADQSQLKDSTLKLEREKAEVSEPTTGESRTLTSHTGTARSTIGPVRKSA